MKTVGKRILEIVSAATIFLLWFLVFLQVLSRFVFRAPISYSLELVQLMFIVSIYIGSAAVHLDKVERHLGFDFLTQKMKGKPLLICSVVGEVVMAAFLVLCVVSGISATIAGAASSLPLSGLSVSWKYVWLPISCIIMLGGSIYNIVMLLKDAKKSSKKEEEV